MRRRPFTRGFDDPRAWERTVARAPWDLHVEAYMPTAASPRELGSWVSSIWRRTAGAPELKAAHGNAVGYVLAWQAGTRTQLEAIAMANLYGAAARAWARRCAA